MALNGQPAVERADHTRVAVGNQGDSMNQEAVTGKQVIRRGGEEADADMNIGTASNPQDLDGGSNDYDSGARNVGGSEAIAGQIVSDDSAQFNVHVDWLDADDNVVITHSPAALQGVTDVDFTLVSRSDRFKVRVEDASGGQNRVHGSINAH